nr:DUF308 domain-containing protein [Arthrobacter sp. BF1]
MCVWLGFTLATRPLASLGALTLYVGAGFIISGIADLILGVAALAWPDATLLLVAMQFGARTLLFGMGRILDLSGSSCHANPAHRCRK